MLHVMPMASRLPFQPFMSRQFASAGYLWTSQKKDTFLFMDERLINSREIVLELSLESLLVALRNKDASRETKIRAVLDFHFTQEEAIKTFLEDLRIVEE
jgi:hypothetical protein